MEKNQNYVTKSELTVIHEADIGKRLIADIMDALMFLFTMLILSLWVLTPIANKAFNYTNKVSYGNQYQVATRLYVLEEKQDNGDYIIIDTDELTSIKEGANRKTTELYYYESDDINFFINRIRYYYLNYKLNENIKLPADTETKHFDAIEDKFADPNYEANKLAYDNEVVSLAPGIDYFDNKYLIDGETSYFLNDGSNNYFLVDESQKETAIKFLKNLAYNATADFFNSDYIIKLNKNISWIQVFIVIPAYVLSFGIYYFLVPLLNENGETLSKKWMKIAVVRKDGYSVMKKQVFFKQFMLFAFISILAFILGMGITSIAMVCFGVFLLLIPTLINKKKRSPFDLAAFTLVIDSKKSVWFKNPEEEQRQLDELEEKMAKYKNTEFIDKKVIQIGDQIIDESILDDKSK